MQQTGVELVLHLLGFYWQQQYTRSACISNGPPAACQETHSSQRAWNHPHTKIPATGGQHTCRHRPPWRSKITSVNLSIPALL